MGAEEEDLELREDNLLQAQVLGACGQVKSLTIDQRYCSHELAMSQRGKFPRLSLRGDLAPCNEDLGHWMSLCGVQHLLCQSTGGGMQDLARMILPQMMRRVHPLQSVGLSFESIDVGALEDLCGLILAAPGPPTISLALTGEFSDASVEHLAKVLPHTIALRDLDLDLRGIGDKAWEALAVSLQWTQGLRSIRLVFEDISNQALMLLCTTVQKFPPMHSISVTFKVVCISSDAAKLLGQTIRGVPSLHHIGVTLNSVNEYALKQVAESIRQAPTLQTIDLTLGDQRIMSTEAMKALCGAIRHTTATQSISLSYPGISAEGWELLADAFAHAPLIQSVRLSAGAIRDFALNLLADAIRQAPSLQSVSFALQGVSDHSVEALAEAIRHAPMLKSIHLVAGGMSDQSRIFLAAAMRDAAALQDIKLIFADDVVGNAAMEDLAQIIRHAPALQEIEMSYDCLVGDAAMSSLAEAVEHAPALTTLRLLFHGGVENGEHAVELLGAALPRAPVLKTVVIQGLAKYAELSEETVQGKDLRFQIVFW